MATLELTFVAPVQLAIASGATTPDPGGATVAGIVIWSTTTSSLLRWSGTAWNPVSAAGAATISSASVDVPYSRFEYTGTITDAAVLSTSKIMLTSGNCFDTDVNTAQDMQASVSRVAAGAFDIRLEPVRPREAIGGIFKFFYQIG